jgi:hypothetical protein
LEDAVKRLLPFLFILSFTSQALAQSYDIAILGQLGRKTLVCVQQDEEARIRFDLENTSGKDKPFGVSLKRVRAGIQKVSAQIRKTTKKKRKKKLKSKRTALKTLLASVRKCQRGEQPLVLAADGAILTIPLSAIPDGIDPGSLSITANGSTVSVDAIALDDAANSVYTFLPDALELNSPATFEVDLPLDVLNGVPFYGILHAGLTRAARGSKESGIQFLQNVTDDVNPENVIGGPSNDVVRFGGQISNFSGGASLVGGDSSFLSISAEVSPAGDIEVGESFTVNYTITRIAGQIVIRAGFKDEDSTDSTKDEDLSLEVVSRGDTWTVESSKASSKTHQPKLLLPSFTEEEREPLNIDVTSDSTTLQKTFFCPEVGKHTVTTSYWALVPVNRVVKRVSSGETVSSKVTTRRVYVGLSSEVNCVKKNSGGNGGNPSACKLTPISTVNCPPPSGSTTAFFVANVPDSIAPGTSFNLLDGNNDLLTQLCEDSTSESILMVDESTVPQSVKDSVLQEPNTDPFWVKASVTGGNGGTQKARLEVFCD